MTSRLCFFKWPFVKMTDACELPPLSVYFFSLFWTVPVPWVLVLYTTINCNISRGLKHKYITYIRQGYELKTITNQTEAKKKFSIQQCSTHHFQKLLWNFEYAVRNFRY